MIVDNPIQGYYLVGNKRFDNKTMAFIVATSTKQQVKWIFHDDVWSKFSTDIPIHTPLKELYKRRAQQLRDKYDYLILSYSGGSDSWTILNTCIQNNIFIDELYIRWPLKAVKGSKLIYTPNTVDMSAANSLSEWDFVIEKDIEWVRKVSPKTKITIYDWTEDATTDLTEKEFYITNHFISLWNIKRFVTQGDLEKRMLDIGKKVGVIFGIDKPLISAEEDGCYMYFFDHAVGLAFADGWRESKVEYFYWTPDMPEIVVAQAQKVASEVMQKRELFNIIEESRKRLNLRYYNDLVKSICFPDYDLNKFQCDKPTSILYSEKEDWASSLPEYKRALESWTWHLNSYFRLIDPKFLDVRNGVVHSLKPLISRKYKICNWSNQIIS
jgi:hypothetical protein